MYYNFTVKAFSDCLAYIYVFDTRVAYLFWQVRKLELSHVYLERNGGCPLLPALALVACVFRLCFVVGIHLQWAGGGVPTVWGCFF